MPESVRPALRRLARRLALGLFLDVWPAWAIASLLAAGVVGLVCRLFFAGAAPYLPWLWLAPRLDGAAGPRHLRSRAPTGRPRSSPLADWLSGGHGLLLTLLEHERSRVGRVAARANGASAFALPRLRPWRRLAAAACRRWRSWPWRCGCRSARRRARTPCSRTTSPPISRRRWRS